MKVTHIIINFNFIMIDLKEVAAQMKEINPQKFTMPQLKMLKEQTEEEVSILSNSYAQLRQASDKFSLSKRRLDNLSDKFKGREILVPLTSSLYVPATMEYTDKVMVELGASYFMEATIPKAGEYCDRKVGQIKENLEQISAIINKKKQLLDSVIVTLQEKIAKEQKK